MKVLFVVAMLGYLCALSITVSSRSLSAKNIAALFHENREQTVRSDSDSTSTSTAGSDSSEESDQQGRASSTDDSSSSMSEDDSMEEGTSVPNTAMPDPTTDDVAPTTVSIVTTDEDKDGR